MTAFRRSNSTDLRSIADDIVRHLDRAGARSPRSGGKRDVSDEPRVAAGNGEYSGRWTKESSAPGDMEEITIHGRPPLTDDQIAAIIFNETRALHGPNLHKARVEMAATIINADAETGGNRAKKGYRTAPDAIKGKISPEEKQALQDIKSAVAEARSLEDSGRDPTHYSTNFDLPAEVDEGVLARHPLDPSYTLQDQYRSFWDSNERTPKSIRIYNNPAAKKHRPK